MTTQQALLFIVAAHRAPIQKEAKAVQVICRINAHARKQGFLDRLRMCAPLVWPGRLDMQGRAKVFGRA